METDLIYGSVDSAIRNYNSLKERQLFRHLAKEYAESFKTVGEILTDLEHTNFDAPTYAVELKSARDILEGLQVLHQVLSTEVQDFLEQLTNDINEAIYKTGQVAKRRISDR